jgi:hypothetical protein
MNRSTIVCIPTIPARRDMLTRAIASVEAQTEPAVRWWLHIDTDGLGAAGNRNACWRQAVQMHPDTEWIGFLDDDDELLPHHVAHCLDVAEQTGADMVYPWHRIVGKYGETKPDLLAGQGVPFDPAELEHRNFIPVTVLVRRELLEAVGGFPEPNTPEWPHPDCEDWGCWKRLVEAGAKIVHTPTVCWLWRHHGMNTSGRADWAAQLPTGPDAEAQFLKIREGR